MYFFITLIERESSMNFSQSSSEPHLLKLQHKLLGHTIFCIDEQGIIEIIGTYE